MGMLVIVKDLGVSGKKNRMELSTGKILEIKPGSVYLPPDIGR
jgi:hypothetical protein